MPTPFNRWLPWTTCVFAAFLCAAVLRPAAGAGDPPGPRVVDRVFTDPSLPIVAGAGQLFLISQEANPSTGYHWTADPAPDPAVVVLRGVAFMTTSGFVGAPGREVRVYEATGSGSASITLAYMPPGAGGKPAKRITFSVTVTPSDAR